MADQFILFRLSLLPRPQVDFLSDYNASREEYLRKVFATEYKFEYWKVTYHYVPAKHDGREALLGRLGRHITVEENLPPDKGLVDSVHEGWKAAVLVIDPRHHKDGQKLAFEYDKQVGEPLKLAARLAHTINEANPHAPYSVEIAPIVDAETFWEFERINEGNITLLSFEFVTPNMFGADDEITDELREFRDAEKARRVKVTLTNSDGLATNTARVAHSVEYTSKSGGNIRARARGNKHYNSTQKTKSVILRDDAPTKEPLLVRAARKISEILGRE